jgi:hypothetical protein
MKTKYLKEIERSGVLCGRTVVYPANRELDANQRRVRTPSQHWGIYEESIRCQQLTVWMTAATQARIQQFIAASGRGQLQTIVSALMHEGYATPEKALPHESCMTNIIQKTGHVAFGVAYCLFSRAD